MQSFRLRRGRFPVGFIALPVAALCCWWLPQVRRVDLGENDFSGLFYLLGSLVLIIVALVFGLTAVICGVVDLQKADRRTMAMLGLAAGVASLILVGFGLCGGR